MKTEDLVVILATGAGPTPSGVAQRRYTVAITAGALGASLVMLGSLGLNPELTQDAGKPPFWMRMGFLVLMCGGALRAMTVLSRPGQSLEGLFAGIAAPLAGMWLLAAGALMTAPSELRPALLLGQTWQVCSFLIAAVSLPALLINLWAMKGLAPIRFRVAGAAAGLCAGALGALVYSFHCPEVAAPFVGVWYVLGMCIPAGVGALAGPKVLAW